MTDACVALGIIDPGYFLGGRVPLHPQAATDAVRVHVAEPLGVDVSEAAAAIVRLATERMVRAIEAITIHKGIDPREAILIGGGGAAGLNVVAIGRRLGCAEILVPTLGPALSAAGALISDLTRTFELVAQTTDATFDYERVNAVLADLEGRCQEFIDGPGAGSSESSIEFSVEARYPHQVWELEVPMIGSRIRDPHDLVRLCEGFHAVHRDVFAIADEHSSIEFTSWHARARCRLQQPAQPHVQPRGGVAPRAQRSVFLPDSGQATLDVWRLDTMPIAEPMQGPGIVESETTTVLVDPDATFELRPSGTIHIMVGQASSSTQPAAAGRRGVER